MGEPTIFYLPRRRLGIGAYVPGPTTTLISFRDVGHINGAELSFERETQEYLVPDLMTGNCRTSVGYTHKTSTMGTLTVELMSDAIENLALMFEATASQSAAGPQSETLPTIQVGQCVNTQLPPDFDQTFEVKDSDASPATLVEGTHYEFMSKAAGGIRILDLASFTQPLKIDYTSKTSDFISPMTKMDEYYYVVLTGANQASACKGDKDEFWKCRISEEQVKRLHEAAENQLPVATTLVLTADRDETRNYDFGQMSRARVA